MQLTHLGRVPNCTTWQLSACVMCSDLAKDTAASTISSTSREINPKIVVWCVYCLLYFYFLEGKREDDSSLGVTDRTQAHHHHDHHHLHHHFHLHSRRLSRTQRSGTNKRVCARLGVVFCFRRRGRNRAAKPIFHFCFLFLFFSFADTNCCSALAQGRRHLVRTPRMHHRSTRWRQHARSHHLASVVCSQSYTASLKITTKHNKNKLHTHKYSIQIRL